MDIDGTLKVIYRPVEALRPHPRNPRTHSSKQVRQIAASIEEFGFTNPILIDAADNIVAGHGRVLAARKLGMAEVPTVRLEHLSEAQRRAYVIADNRLAEKAGWDRELLVLELEYLAELDIDLELLGFETPEVDLLLDTEPEGRDGSRDDVLPDGGARAVVSRPGDLWHCGNHRLLCGDATAPAAYARLMSTLRARMVISDPPFNVPIHGHVSGLGKTRHREFVMASGELSEAAFIVFLQTICRHLVSWSCEGSLHYLFIDWRHLFALLTAARGTYREFKNLCVWNKTNAGMGSFYRSKHELVTVFKNGAAPHVNNIELGVHGRHRSNVWDYPGVNTFRQGRQDDLRLHPTVKPVALIADAIRDASRRGDVILDPFVGSGTTLVAAQKTGRRCFAMELDPRYVDTAIRRWEDHTGELARHADTGELFAEIAQQRLDKRGGG